MVEQSVDTYAKFSNSLDIKLINVEETLNIRQQILRPKLTASDCIFPGDYESSTHHFGAFLCGELVAIVSLFNQNTDKVLKNNGQQIRAMATLEKFQGQGVGNKLLSALEAYAFEQGADYLWANARVSAQAFYRKAGYTVDKNVFMINGVGDHVLVCKQRSSA